MNWTMDDMELNDNQTQIRCININRLLVREGHNYVYWSQLNTKNTELNEIVVWVGQLSYKSIKHVGSVILIATMFFLYFPDPFLMKGLSHYIAPLNHLDPTLVDHPNPYLSTCPIRHPLWFSVSCSSQCSTVQRSSPHKCGQKSSCSAFNAVVAAFP